MGRPVIIDDGGSIRIRLGHKPGDVGEMNTLLNVDSEYKKSVQQLGESYDEVRTFWLEEKNCAVQSTPIYFQNEILISGDRGLEVKVEKIDSGKALEITVISSSAVPMIESKQHGMQRSYTVVNGGRIKQVEVDGNKRMTVTIPVILAGVVIT